MHDVCLSRFRLIYALAQIFHETATRNVYLHIKFKMIKTNQINASFFFNRNV